MPDEPKQAILAVGCFERTAFRSRGTLHDVRLLIGHISTHFPLIFCLHRDE